MALINIGGSDLPTPTDYKADRNTNGTMIIERIRAGVRKIELSWTYLTAAQLSQVLNAVSPVFFTVTYMDPIDNANRTGTFYSGDRNCGMIDFKAGVPRYKDIKFNLIEK
jgi:hypothetical protein